MMQITQRKHAGILFKLQDTDIFFWIIICMATETERGGGELKKNIGLAGIIQLVFNVSANQGNDDEGVKGDGSKVGSDGHDYEVVKHFGHR